MLMVSGKVLEGILPHKMTKNLLGIGPRTTLERQNIIVISDLPGVGQNLWDHADRCTHRSAVDHPTGRPHRVHIFCLWSL